MKLSENEKRYSGIILVGFLRVIDFLSEKTSILLGFYKKKDFPQVIYDDSYLIKATKRVDYLNMIWWFIIIACYIVMVYTEGWICTLILIIVLLRIINIVSRQLRVIFITYSDDGDSITSRIVSTKRNLLFAFIHYIELIICFASIYANFPQKLKISSDSDDKLVYLYFSNISQLTIGYGDITPLGFIRFVVSFQGMIGLLIVALTIGKFVGMIPIKDALKTRD
jgi:Ion channel